MWVSFWKGKTLIKGVNCPTTVNWTSRKKKKQWTFSTCNYLDQIVCSVTSVMSNSLWPQRTVAHRAPLSMGFSRQEYWSRLPLPPLGDLPDLGIKPGSPTLQADSLPSESPGKPKEELIYRQIDRYIDRYSYTMEFLVIKRMKYCHMQQHGWA